MKPKSGLFRLWSVITDKTTVTVLPEPVDHGVLIESHQNTGPDDEIASLELIRDERLLSKKDQKLFQKTGKPFMRTRASAVSESKWSLRWKKLANLVRENQEQQFSFWLEPLENTASIEIEAPFCEEGTVTVAEAKRRFADWAARNA